jgi:Heavy metal binding domain
VNQRSERYHPSEGWYRYYAVFIFSSFYNNPFFMKNVVWVLIAIASVVACKNEQPKTTVATPAPAATAAPAPKTEMAAIYHCPMHPEVTGKEGDKCDKCGGMKLVLKK